MYGKDTLYVWEQNASTSHVGEAERKELSEPEECNLTATKMLAHYEAINNSPNTQAGSTSNITPWSLAANQLLPTEDRKSVV